MLKNYLKIAFRNIRKHKVYSFINITGLAIGLTVFFLIALYIQFELSYDRFHENFDRIYRLEQILDHNGPKELTAGCPAALSGPLAADFPEFEAISRVIATGEILLSRPGGERLRDAGFSADSSFFDIFTFPLIKGDPKTALDAPYSIVITEDLGAKLFRDEDPMGQVIKANDNMDLTVTGVMKNVPDNSHISFGLLLSSTTIRSIASGEILNQWHDNWVPLYVLLRPGYSIENVAAKIRFILKKYQGERSRHELYLKPLSRIHLHSHVSHEIGINGSIRNIYTLTAIAVFVLVIAGINFMNLATARSADRAKEVGMRKVSGAYRTSLIRQFMGESFLMAFIAMAGALIVMVLVLPEFSRIVNRNLQISILDNGMFALGLLGITAAVGGLSGIYPAFILSSFQPSQVLKGTLTTTFRRTFLRKALVVFQFVISVTLISGTIIVLQQVNFLLHKDLGYESEQIITFPINNLPPEKYRAFRSELIQNPHVLDVASSDYMPHSSTNWTRVSWEGAETGEWMKINVNYVDENLIPAYGMEIVAGRAFSKEFPSDKGKVVILNESAVKRIGWENPVGKQIRYWGDYRMTEVGPTTVVGVVKDYHFLSLHNPINPIMLRPFNDEQIGGNLSVKVSGRNIPETIAFIEGKFHGIFPEEVLEYRFLNDDFANMYQEEAKLGRVIFYLATLAIFIACLGLFGLASFSTKQRTKEIGIRKVVGASTSGITWLLNRDFLKLTLWGCLPACPAAYFFMSRWLQNFPYRIQIQFWVFAVASASAMAIALATISFQSIKAAAANPITSLRYE